MKHFYLVILLAFLPALATAQEENLEQEIMNYPGTRTQLITKGRSLLLDKFLEGDIEKVKEVKDYLINEVENEDYIALYPGEHWMILYWTGEHERLQELVVQFNQDSIARYQHKIAPQYDRLYHKLIERSWDRLEMLENKINNSSLDLQTKDFLLLHLNFMVSGEPVRKLSQEEVNAMADLYLETHPDSRYDEYIKNNIRFKFVPSKWAFGFEFFSGFGFFTGELKDLYSSNIPLGVDFDVEYNRFTLFLRAYIGLGTTLQERENAGTVWASEAQTRVYLPEASLGYAVLENDRLKISPYLGIGAAAISPTDYDLESTPGLENLEVGFSTAYTLGLNFNFKLGWEVAPLLSVEQDKSYWFIRVRYGYTMPQFNDFPGHSGNIHHITLGLGGIYRGMKRAL